MKIISVIVDELPEECNGCEVRALSVCDITNAAFIVACDLKKVSSFCKLRQMPSDEEVQKIDFMTGSWSYDQGIEDGINWLKSKLT